MNEKGKNWNKDVTAHIRPLCQYYVGIENRKKRNRHWFAINLILRPLHSCQMQPEKSQERDLQSKSTFSAIYSLEYIEYRSTYYLIIYTQRSTAAASI